MQTQFPVQFNGYLAFILGLMLVSFLLDLLANTLNTIHLQPELPKDFEGIYDVEKYRKSIHYQRDGFRFETLQSTLGFVVTVFFILSGSFNTVDNFVRGFGLGETLTGVLFVGALIGLQFVFNLPFSIYDTFVFEQAYGFNKTTPKTFVLDMIKGAFLSILLGAPIFSLVIWFFGSTGQNGWLYSWVAFSALQILLTFLAPALIMPLFNKFEPLAESELKRDIERFAVQENFVLGGIFKMDSSKRSTKSNAFFTGFGKFRRLVLFDTLIEKQTPEELVAVLAHEIGHFKRRHIQKSIILSICTTGIVFFVLGLFLNNPELFAAFAMKHVSVYASLVFVTFLLSPFMKLLSIFTHLLSRKHEFEADEYAARSYKNPEALISALKKLSMDNLSNLTPHPLKVFLDYTHPPVMQRIEALRRFKGAIR